MSLSSLKITLHFLVSSELELELGILLRTAYNRLHFFFKCNQIIFHYEMFVIFIYLDDKPCTLYFLCLGVFF